MSRIISVSKTIDGKFITHFLDYSDQTREVWRVESYIIMSHEVMVAWIEQGVPMPRAPRIKHDPKAPDGVARDEHGNALEGLRTPWVEVPDATYLAKYSQKNPLKAGLRPFSDKKMKELYGSRKRYLQLVNEQIDKMVRDRWVMTEDADLMRLKS